MHNIFVTLQNSINGDGLWYPSISIYYSGCDKIIKCKNCHNPELQLKGVGFETSDNQLIQDIEEKLIMWLSTYEIVSICYLGGEPLASWNRKSVFEVSKYFKEKYKNQVCNVLYTWRYINDLHTLKEYISYIDYGVLGDFREEYKDLNYIPSSINQYIYDFNKQIKIKAIKKG
jgi:anaerobic ribonucleoside-triphosphate reductase activating protein